MVAYKFNPNSSCSDKPDNEITRLLEKAQPGAKLEREEKNRIADLLYGVCGQSRATYKLAGWAWPMSHSLPRILVSFTFEPATFNTYFAPDKTSLRYALTGTGLPIAEMIYADNKRRI